MEKIKVSYFLLAALIGSVILVPGCKKQEASGPEASASSPASAGGLPIADKPITLRVLSETRRDRTMSNSLRTVEELEKRTNIHLEWETLPVDAADRNAKFNAVIASGDIPDIVDGIVGADTINRYGMQGIFLAFNDLIKQYAPNMTAVFNNPLQGDEIPYSINVWGEITAKDGKIYNIPIVSASNAIGPVWAIRTDWLDKLGLSMPSTADELYTVLKAFKEKDPNGNGQADEIPFGSSNGGKAGRITPLVNAFDAHMDLYVDPADKRIKYGPIEPAYRTALAYLNKLYSEGLIEQDYLTATNDQWFARAGGNRMGLHFVWPGSGLGSATTELQKLDSSYHFEPMPPLKSPSGKQYKDTKSAGNAVLYRTSASAKTKYPVEITKYLDYIFSPEGELLASWGLEGETYTMVNGAPQFNDFIMRNPEGKDPETAQIHFGIRWNLLPYQNPWAPNFQSMSATAPWTVQAWQIYQKPGLVETPMPTLGLTEDELSRRLSIVAEIDTYKDPMIDKFIMGTEPLSKFDEFVANIKRAGLDELLEMLNKAYDIYKANS
jgi:putative aldouronate transport system substrate-binding protein